MKTVNGANILQKNDETKKYWDNISISILVVVFLSSIVFCEVIKFVDRNVLHNQLEYNDTTSKYLVELKMIGTPEMEKLISYEMDKGKRGSYSKLHIIFDYTLAKDEVLKYYQKSFTKNGWKLVSEQKNNWIYEKQQYQINLTYLEGKWNFFMSKK